MRGENSRARGLKRKKSWARRRRTDPSCFSEDKQVFTVERGQEFQAKKPDVIAKGGGG